MLKKHTTHLTNNYWGASNCWHCSDHFHQLLVLQIQTPLHNLEMCRNMMCCGMRGGDSAVGFRVHVYCTLQVETDDTPSPNEKSTNCTRNIEQVVCHIYVQVVSGRNTRVWVLHCVPFQWPCSNYNMQWMDALTSAATAVAVYTKTSGSSYVCLEIWTMYYVRICERME